MKINIFIDTLHNVYMRAKHGFLVVFCLSFIGLVALSQQARGESVVSNVDTKVTFTANGKTTYFITKENTLANALTAKGIKLEKNDITEPPLITPLIGADVSARLVVAVPVLINDNGQSWVGSSAYTETSDILGQLNIVVDKADRVSRELILDPVTENMAGQKINIERAPVFTVSVDDKEVFVHSWKQTVAEVLAEGGITLNQNDTVIPAKEATAPISGQIVVTRVNFSDIEEISDIDFDTVYKIDSSLGLKGQKVIQEGQVGRVLKKYHIVYNNGVVISKILISSNTMVTSQNRVVAKGAEIGYANFGLGRIYEGMVTSYHSGYTGHRLLVTNLNNGKQVTVTIIGSGPFDGGLMDMGTEPFQLLGGNLSSGHLYNVAVQMLD